MMKYKFDTSSEKFLCPSCSKKRFVKFLDSNNKYLPSEYGKCDRVINCGYEQRPNMHFTQNFKPIKTLQKKIEISFVEPKIALSTLKNYKMNSLYNYLIIRFDEKRVEQVFKKYCVGTAKFWGGSPIFWQVDLDGNFRSGKIIKYDRSTGKRVKKPFNHVHWAHKLLKLTDFNLCQVPFGIHLLEEFPTKTICLLESEKTALVMDLFCPEFLWISIGSLTLLKSERISCMKGRKIILFPDSDGFELWKKQAIIIEQQLNQQIFTSDLIEKNSIQNNANKGVDIADLILESLNDSNEGELSQ